MDPTNGQRSPPHASHHCRDPAHRRPRVGGGIIATTAYQAGLTAGTAVTTTAAGGATTVTPVVVLRPTAGWLRLGLGVFGFFFLLFFLFIVFALIRAIFWGGRVAGVGGWGPARRRLVRLRGLAARARAGSRAPHQTFDEWHRRARTGRRRRPARIADDPRRRPTGTA